jgi:hypothetical protein
MKCRREPVRAWRRKPHGGASEGGDSRRPPVSQRTNPGHLWRGRSAWAIEYTLDWATGLEDISPTRLFADGKRIAAFFLGSRKKYERQVYGDDMTRGCHRQEH